MTLEQGNLLIVWNDLNQTGVKILDEQHRGIVTIINALHYSLFVREKDTLLSPTVEMVMGYTKIHFKTEMEFLEEAGYPGLQEHHAQHERLIADAENVFMDCLKEGGEPTPFLKFLKDWWLVHINREDMAYSGHLLEYLHSGRRVIVKRG